MSTEYDITELRSQTRKHTIDKDAHIKCLDCNNKRALTIDEDQPVVAAMISYCPLCDGLGYITKARALAVLPHISAYIKELKSKGEQDG